MRDQEKNYSGSWIIGVKKGLDPWGKKRAGSWIRNNELKYGFSSKYEILRNEILQNTKNYFRILRNFILFREI
jgi:hypothetical protein